MWLDVVHSGLVKEYEWDLARREKFDQRASVVLNSFRLVQIDKLPLRLEHNYPLYMNDGWSMDGWMVVVVTLTGRLAH